MDRSGEATAWLHSHGGDLAMDSPFHPGEQAIQARLGVQGQIESQGRRIIRNYLLDQHRQFFAQLSYLLVGAVDAAGCPWASIVVGQSGFLTTPDAYTLQVMAQPLFGDPLGNILSSGIDIGLLGIELHTRRRNRLNGIVKNVSTDRFEVTVRQSFGNCPKYIQSRMFEFREPNPIVKPIKPIAVFGAAEQALIAAADTCFIATAYQAESAGAARGVDVSHRGGKPGFVRIDDDRTLTIPDFAGNLYFNTFGNLALNALAGLLFIDFAQGDLLYLTGRAEVIWEGPEISTYPGAERLLRFHLDRGHRVTGSLPLCWSEPVFSTHLDRMALDIGDEV
jgi:uncharacterized protein